MTNREWLQSVASNCGFSGNVQYISSYARNVLATDNPGWYLLTNFRRVSGTMIMWDNGRYLGRTQHDAFLTLIAASK